MNHRSGFTLLELLVVVGILAALVALALPYYQDYVNQSKITAGQADLTTFKKALSMYDQLEVTPFNDATADFRILIGKYIQDFRTSTTQIVPRDPWGGDYVFRSQAGTIISGGPNGYVETTDVTARIPVGDDLLVTWKPPFFVASARAINATTVEVTFSRKVVDTSVGGGAVTTVSGSTDGLSANKFKLSDTVYRFDGLAITQTGGNHTLTMGSITAMDGKVNFHAFKPDETTAGNSADFVF